MNSGTKSSYDLLIEKLDSFVRKYYTNQLIKGSLLTLGLLLVVFLGFNLLEHFFYFNQGIRKLFFLGFLGLTGFCIAYFIALPASKYFRLGKTISHEQAAAIIGKHFTDVKDKLLNILQLKDQSGNTSNALIEASINQKSDEIKLTPFKSAIDLSRNKKFLKYALAPFLLLLVILFAAPSMITDSTHRIINNDQNFERKALFSLELQNEQYEVLQYDDYLLELDVTGSVLPAEVYITVDDYEYKMQKSSEESFYYNFKNVQKDINFEVHSANVSTGPLKIKMLPKPNLLDLQLKLDYPSYTMQVDEMIKNIGDVTVPQGSRITWLLDASNTESIDVVFANKNEKISATRDGKSSFSFEKRMYQNDQYSLFFNNEYIKNGDSIKYHIQVVPDQHPTISIEQVQDEENPLIAFLAGNAADDYGLTQLYFHYQIIKEDGSQKAVEKQKIDADLSGRATQFDYLFDIEKINLLPGEQVIYFFEVFDNDGIHQPKSTRSPVMSYAKASVDEYEQKEDQNEEDIKKNIEEALKESRDIKKDLKKLREKLLQEKDLDWKAQKEFEELKKRQEEMQEKMKDAQEKMQENLENEKEFKQENEELQEKQEKMQEMMEEAMDSEMNELMQKIQDLMQELNKDQAVQEMQKMEMSEENMEKSLERMKELYKQLEVEKEIQDAVQKLEELAEKQEKLAEETQNQEKSKEELTQEQEKLNEEFEELQEEMKELEKMNEELEVPKSLPEHMEEEMKDIQKEMQNSQQQIQQNENQKASDSQKSAGQKMKEIAENMQSEMEAGDQQQMDEDLKTLRQLLENIVTLSFEQEELVNELGKIKVNTPSYTDLVQDQFKIQDDFQMVEDSLIELSKRVEQIESFITEKVTEVKYNLENSISNLEERKLPFANQNQRSSMTNLNDLALMLSEAMQQMQQQMAAQMSGNQMCNKPGGSNPKPGSVPMDKITQGQQEMGRKLDEMGQKQKQGAKDGKDGLSSKDFAEAAARQAALRKALEDAQKQRQEEGKGQSKELQQIIEEMNKNEIDLVNKRLNAEMLKRNQSIETRLLEAEKADRQREYDNKRKSESAKDYKREMPKAIEEYIKKRKAEIEMYKHISPDLKPYYQKLVQEYYNSLKVGH